MIRRPNSAALRCEALEARDVPAIILDATASGSDIAPNGGVVNISELQLASTTMLLNRNGSMAPGQTKSATAGDVIRFTSSGATLTIFCSDGIFGRTTNMAGNPIVTYGTTLAVNNALRLSVFLQLGGDDNVNDTTTFGSSINGGPGTDSLTGAGVFVDPALNPFFFNPDGTLNVPLVQVVAASQPPKTLIGGTGNDTLVTAGIPGAFVLDGSAGDDTLIGAAPGIFTTFLGGDGNDTIVGGFTIDVLDGGSGIDILIGLGGGDVYNSIDALPDFVFNQEGDFVSADPFDFIAVL